MVEFPRLDGTVTMKKTAPDEEILEFAIAREVEAHNFYMALAERVQSPEIAKVFEELAKEELEHKAKLELEVIKTGKTLSPTEKVTIPDHEYIISDVDSALDMDYKDVLMLGMEKEEAAFRTYVNLIASVHDEESQEVLMALAEEEVKHKLRFETEYDLLLKKK
jgi:rubrerythrin